MDDREVQQVMKDLLSHQFDLTFQNTCALPSVFQPTNTLIADINLEMEIWAKTVTIRNSIKTG